MAKQDVNSEMWGATTSFQRHVLGDLWTYFQTEYLNAELVRTFNTCWASQVVVKPVLRTCTKPEVINFTGLSLSKCTQRKRSRARNAMPKLTYWEVVLPDIRHNTEYLMKLPCVWNRITGCYHLYICIHKSQAWCHKSSLSGQRDRDHAACRS